MKLLGLLFCLIFGHNKILESKRVDRNTVFYSLCIQCERKWIIKKLSNIPKIQFKKQVIKMRAHGQKIVINTIPQEILHKKQKINFYVL